MGDYMTAADMDAWASEENGVFVAREALLKDARARDELFRCAGIGAKVASAGRFTRTTVDDKKLVELWKWLREQNPTDNLSEVCKLTAEYAAAQIKRKEPFNSKYIENRVRPLLQARREWNRGRGPKKE